jgi:hypothetical protein
MLERRETNQLLAMWNTGLANILSVFRPIAHNVSFMISASAADSAPNRTELKKGFFRGMGGNWNKKYGKEKFYRDWKNICNCSVGSGGGKSRQLCCRPLAPAAFATQPRLTQGIEDARHQRCPATKGCPPPMGFSPHMH